MKFPAALGSFLTTLFCFAATAFAQSEVRTYPAPEGEAVTGVYAVTVNGQPVDVYAAQSEYFEGDYYFASFDFSGTVEIKISSPFPMEKTAILPERFAVEKINAAADSVTLRASEPFRISVEPNGRIKPLLLFGNAVERDAPEPNAPNVVYFAPGVHRPGKITLTDNQTLYLAGGAVVKGAVCAKGENIVIRGRGILAGEESPRFKGPGRYPLDCLNCKNLTVRDLTLRNPWSWTFVVWNCDGVKIDNVKICGSRMINDDALDLVNSQNVTVSNSFFRTQDDSIAVKGMIKDRRPCENIRIENCQFWTDLANIFRIGYECETEAMRNIEAVGIDVLHYSKNFREPSAYWANAIFWLQPSRRMPLENCRFDDIAVYADGSNIIMLMAKPMRCSCGKEKDKEPGSLKNCSFKNLRVVGNRGDFQGLLYFLGDSAEYGVDNLRFEKIDYFGEPVTRKSPCVVIGDFTENINFQ